MGKGILRNFAAQLPLQHERKTAYFDEVTTHVRVELTKKSNLAASHVDIDLSKLSENGLDDTANIPAASRSLLKIFQASDKDYSDHVTISEYTT